jgi:lipopolysaccharide transport protein LptA
MNTLYSPVLKSIIFLITLTFSSVFAQGEESEPLVDQNLKQEQLYIESDSMTYDDKKLISTYKGNVIVKQNFRELYGDEIWVSYNADRSLKEIEVFGAPAKFNQSKTSEQDEFETTALYIKYTEKTKLLELKEQVYFNQKGLKSSSEELTYKVDTGEINAKSGSNSRVEMILN